MAHADAETPWREDFEVVALVAVSFVVASQLRAVQQRGVVFRCQVVPRRRVHIDTDTEG